MLEWLINNKEWLLSGIAVAIPLSLIGWFISKHTSKNKNTQSQISGDNSENIQAGGNVIIKHRKQDNE